MIRHGTGPYRPKRKDYDFVPSFHPQLFGATAKYPEFPAEFLTDTTNWLPDQNADGLPYGCTSYSTVKLALILGVKDATVAQIEAVTNANAKGGYGVIEAMDAGRKLGWFKWRYILQNKGILDWFDGMRLMQMQGLGLKEQRAITWGTPWFHSWSIAILSGERIMPMPTPEELASIKKNPRVVGWHDHVPDGWSQNFAIAPSKLLYRDSSWQGTAIGYVYFPREVINAVQDLYGTVAATGTNYGAPSIKSIPLPEWFWSLMHSWFNFSY